MWNVSYCQRLITKKRKEVLPPPFTTKITKTAKKTIFRTIDIDALRASVPFSHSNHFQFSTFNYCLQPVAAEGRIQFAPTAASFSTFNFQFSISLFSTSQSVT
jgi:hypothetical protein